MRKLVWFTLGFALAMALGAYVLMPQMYFYMSGVAALALAGCLLAMLRFPKVRIAAMVAFGLVVGLVWQSVYEANYLSAARSYDGQTLKLTLTATEFTELTEYGAATQCRVMLSGKSYKLVAYHDETISLTPGQTMTGSFLLRCTLPGCDSDSEYNRAKGLFLVARVKSEVTVDDGNPMPWYAYSAIWRHSILERICQLFPADVSGFARALLLGDTDGIDYATDTAMKVSGIRHVIAVSGLHVSILFSLLYSVCAKKKWLTAILGLPALALFAALAGFSPSIIRACIMHGLTVLALLVEKEYDPPSALSFAALCMLVANPWSVTDVSLQLSVGCLVGILLLSAPIQNWLMDPKRLGKFRNFSGKMAQWFASGVSVSLSANVFTTILCARYFGMVSIVGVLTNLLTLWIISFLFCGILLALAASVVLLPLGSAIAWLVSWGIRYVLLMANALSAFPLGAVYTQSIYIVCWLAFSYVLLTIFLLQRQKHPLVLGCCWALALFVALLISWQTPQRDELRMTMLDVGQGQCILLQSDGKNYLVDCGGDSDTAAADQAAALLLSQGIQTLDGLILTHYDTDHAAGALLLMQRIGVDVLFLPNSLDSEGMVPALLGVAKGKVITIDRNAVIEYGETKLTLIPSQNAQSDNESGLSILCQRKDCDILITGDRSANGERELIEQMALPQLDVLVVGHHGSKYSTCRELLITTKPTYACISVGEDNFYGHPAQELLDRLKAFGCTVLRTDLHGNITYRG